MVIIGWFREEALLHSVNAIPSRTPSADDADAWAIINKITLAQLVVTPPPVLENVPPPLPRQLVPESSEQKGHWHWPNKIPQNHLPRLQKQNKRSQEMILPYLNTHHLLFIFIYQLHIINTQLTLWNITETFSVSHPSAKSSRRICTSTNPDSLDAGRGLSGLTIRWII